MNVLLTGGTGYIGSHTPLAVLAAGHEPILFDDYSNSRPDVVDRLSEIAGPPDSGETLRFAAECAASGAMIGMSPDLPLTKEGRNELAFEFNVPADCGLVKLALRRTKPGSSDALIDDIRLRRT